MIMKTPFKEHKREMFIIRKTAPGQLHPTLLSLIRSALKLNIITHMYKCIWEYRLDSDNYFRVKIVANPPSPGW